MHIGILGRAALTGTNRDMKSYYGSTKVEADTSVSSPETIHCEHTLQCEVMCIVRGSFPRCPIWGSLHGCLHD